MPGTWLQGHRDARGAEKRDLALKLGAHYYIDSSTQILRRTATTGGRAVFSHRRQQQFDVRHRRRPCPQGEMIVRARAAASLWLSMPFLSSSESARSSAPHRPSIDSETLSRSALSRAYARCRDLATRQGSGAYRRMMNNEARFRIVLVTGQ